MAAVSASNPLLFKRNKHAVSIETFTHNSVELLAKRLNSRLWEQPWPAERADYGRCHELRRGRDRSATQAQRKGHCR
ncbi:hypothetical protein V5799_019844 [Amblyomma americanum]|uniref:Uncharacterized protein n=1 Tax=Amblyomma americanum TaxID=6943 RepID=A0AAQ4EVC9_AMBAM